MKIEKLLIVSCISDLIFNCPSPIRFKPYPFSFLNDIIQVEWVSYHASFSKEIFSACLVNYSALTFEVDVGDLIKINMDDCSFSYPSEMLSDNMGNLRSYAAVFSIETLISRHFYLISDPLKSINFYPWLLCFLILISTRHYHVQEVLLKELNLLVISFWSV